MQLRINLETMQADGSARPAGGVISAYEPPSGAGIRVDGYGYAGYATSPSYDSLLAKVIVQGEDFPAALRRAYRASANSAWRAWRATSTSCRTCCAARSWRTTASAPASSNSTSPRCWPATGRPPAPVRQRRRRPGRARRRGRRAGWLHRPERPSQGVLVSLEVDEGDAVAVGQAVAVLEAMKMEFVVKASHSGIVRALPVAPGDALFEGAALLYLEPAEVDGDAVASEESLDLAHIRADLAEVLERHAITRDERRPDAVARRRKTGQRTTRENLDDLLDAGSFIEYGALALAAQRRRRTLDELIQQSPADGLVAGLGTVNAEHFGSEAARCMAISYDYTVFAGTQGVMNHKKTDRMLGLAEQWRLPLVLFAEGGGGRPGIPTSSAWPGWTATPSSPWPGSPAWCRWWASSPAAVSPATPRCWAAAT